MFAIYRKAEESLNDYYGVVTIHSILHYPILVKDGFPGAEKYPWQLLALRGRLIASYAHDHQYADHALQRYRALL